MDTELRLREIENDSTRLDERVQNLTDRVGCVETKLVTHDVEITGVKMKLDLFYQEWKIYTETQAERRTSKRWGIEQTLAAVALIIALTTAFAAPAYVITKLAPQAVEQID